LAQNDSSRSLLPTAATAFAAELGRNGAPLQDPRRSRCIPLHSVPLLAAAAPPVGGDHLQRADGLVVLSCREPSFPKHALACHRIIEFKGHERIDGMRGFIYVDYLVLDERQVWLSIGLLS